MHSLKIIFVFLVSAFVLASYWGTALSNADGVNIGDRRDQVIQALGEPNGATTIADMEILYYPGGQVEMKNGGVVSHNLIMPKGVAGSPQNASVAKEINIGDRREDVIQVLGQPKGTTTFMGTEVLHFPRGKVELESGHVTAFSLMTPEELAAHTEKRLQAEETMRQRRAEQKTNLENQVTLLDDKGSDPTVLKPKKYTARDLYKVGTLSNPNKYRFSRKTYESDFYPKTDWKKYKGSLIPYIFVEQGTNDKETALYRKHPMSNTKGTLAFNVRRHDQNKTLTLYTRSSGDKPAYLLEFSGNGEVPVYRFKAGLKSPDWSYLVRRYGVETEGRFEVYRSQSHVKSLAPTLIIEVDRATGKAAVFRTLGITRIPEELPVRIYEKQKDRSLLDPFSEEVIAIIAAVNFLKKK